MKRKWLFAGTLAVGIVAMGLSSAALAQDQYCAGHSSQHNAYVDRYDTYADRYATYGNQGYGSARPYDSYDGRYSHESNYGSPYGGYPDGQYRYSRPSSRYSRDESRYGRYDSRYDRDEYRGQAYGNGVVYEDHTRSTLRLFPFPHIDKTTVHHQHPTYDY